MTNKNFTIQQSDIPGLEKLVAVFHRLHDDGIHRGTGIYPDLIVSIEALVPPREINGGLAHTSIKHVPTEDTREVQEELVFEQFNTVISTIASLMSVRKHIIEHYTGISRDTMGIEPGFKHRLKYGKPPHY